jgi:hypothetical protein
MSNGHNTFSDELAPRRFRNCDACDPLIDNAPDVEEPLGVGPSDLGHLHPTSPFLAHRGISSDRERDGRILSSHPASMLAGVLRGCGTSRSVCISERDALHCGTSQVRVVPMTVRLHPTRLRMRITMPIAGAAHTFGRPPDVCEAIASYYLNGRRSRVAPASLPSTAC